MSTGLLVCVSVYSRYQPTSQSSHGQSTLNTTTKKKAQINLAYTYPLQLNMRGPNDMSITLYSCPQILTRKGSGSSLVLKEGSGTNCYDLELCWVWATPAVSLEPANRNQDVEWEFLVPVLVPVCWFQANHRDCLNPAKIQI